MRLRHPFLPLAAVALIVALAGCAPSSDPATVTPIPLTSSAELGTKDGYVAPGDWLRLTDDVPAITNLDAGLRDALVRANEAAMADRDLELVLLDGWRSERYQNHLFEQAVVQYGSEEEASRWVKRGTESLHVQGLAVDIATADAMDWLSRFGGEFGLCQIYVNEAWHFELAANEAGECPEQLPDGSAG